MSLERIAEWAVPCLDADPGPIARLEAVMAAGNTPEVVFARLTGEKPETLGEIAKSWQVPVGRFVQWFVTEHEALYDAALKVLAQQDAVDVVRLADEAGPESVQVQKLRAEVRKWRASKWDSERYGDKQQVKHTGLVPTLVIEIAQPEAAHRVIEHVDGGPDPI